HPAPRSRQLPAEQETFQTKVRVLSSFTIGSGAVAIRCYELKPLQFGLGANRVYREVPSCSTKWCVETLRTSARVRAPSGRQPAPSPQLCNAHFGVKIGE